MRCNQCDALVVNGTFCHETGCPNIGARFDRESGEWVKQRECFTCGYTVDVDTDCCAAADQESFSSYSLEEPIE